MTAAEWKTWHRETRSSSTEHSGIEVRVLADREPTEADRSALHKLVRDFNRAVDDETTRLDLASKDLTADLARVTLQRDAAHSRLVGGAARADENGRVGELQAHIVDLSLEVARLRRALGTKASA